MAGRTTSSSRFVALEHHALQRLASVDFDIIDTITEVDDRHEGSVGKGLLNGCC